MSDMERKANANASGSSRRRLRIWPAVILLLVMAGLKLTTFLVDDLPITAWMALSLGPVACAAGILLWWLLISRASGPERIWGTVGIGAGYLLTTALSDPSMIGPAMLLMTVPLGFAGFALGAWIRRNDLTVGRTVTAVVLATIGFGVACLFRSEGFYGDNSMALRWRFATTAEQRLVEAREKRSSEGEAAQRSPELDVSIIEAALADPQWSEFRGPRRDSRVAGINLESDWSANPPEPQWKIDIGPGWSSFSVAGDLLFTQEQRGDEELVVCYSAKTGQELWARGVSARFEDNLGGPGPRATPTIADSDLFVMGASGHLMRLDARSGEQRWQVDIRDVAKRNPPTWGFCSSPLVTDGLVIVHAGGGDDLGMLAFGADDGALVWSVASGDHSYSSPQICTVGGEPYVAVLTNAGVDLVDPKSGEVQLAYPWPLNDYRTLQPQVIEDDSLLLPAGGEGSRLLKISNADGQLQAEELWTSRHLKPDFNDLVTHDGYAYGFDGTIFSCVDLANGERTWKRGRYGKGQVLLLADSGQLLVLSERGDIVLLQADPDSHRELAKFPAIEGKTWNHPVLVGDRLYVRNSTEAACIRLPLAQSGASSTPDAQVSASSR